MALHLAPCVYTGLPTVWRRKDGAPALCEAGLRTAIAHGAKLDLEKIIKTGVGVMLAGTLPGGR